MRFLRRNEPLLQFRGFSPTIESKLVRNIKCLAAVVFSPGRSMHRAGHNSRSPRRLLILWWRRQPLAHMVPPDGRGAPASRRRFCSGISRVASPWSYRDIDKGDVPYPSVGNHRGRYPNRPVDGVRESLRQDRTGPKGVARLAD